MAWGKGSQPSTVVELFTSQGCSSCPPADRLIGEYAERDDVLALSFNVDLWDWIGWPDTLASPEYTERQRAYARAMGERGVYTPQAVIDGRTLAVGSHREAIEAAWSPDALTVPIDVTLTEDTVSVKVGAAREGEAHKAVLWVVLYDSAVAVDIERGENAGETVTYHNVVRDMRPVAMWKGDELVLDQSRMEMDHADVDGCAFLLQVEREDGLPGPMIGAARIDTSW